MYGTTIYQFTPEQLVKEMLSNISEDEVLSEKQAQGIYGRYNIEQWIEKGQLVPDRLTSAEGSKKLIKRIDIERIILNKKYLQS